MCERLEEIFECRVSVDIFLGGNWKYDTPVCWKNLFDFDERSHVWNVRSLNVRVKGKIDLWPLPVMVADCRFAFTCPHDILFVIRGQDDRTGSDIILKLSTQ